MLDPESLLGRTFLTKEEPDGTRHRVRIVELINEYENNAKQDPKYREFRVKI